MSPDRARPDRRYAPSRPATDRADGPVSSPPEHATSAVVAPVSTGSWSYLTSNASVMLALQRAAGNDATQRAVSQSLTVQRDRAELDAAYRDEVSAGEWGKAAVRLNGFNDADINARVKDLGYDKRALLLAACPDWNHRVRRPALDMNYKEDVEAGRLEHAAGLLNGFNEPDIISRFGSLPVEKHLALLIACPDSAKRVLEIGLRLQPKQKTRVWPVADFIAIWEKLHGRTMTPDEKNDLSRGCIGITSLNLADGAPNPPLGLSFDSFEHARAVSRALNDILATAPTVTKYGEAVGLHPLLSQLTGVVSALPSSNPAEWRAVVFSKRFYANQNPDWNKRKKADTRSFKPNPDTGQVDMSGYKYKGRPDPSEGLGAEMVNFDYGWYDEATNTWWHANHSEPGMKVYQSTLKHYSQPLLNFDRQVFTVALAKK